MTTLPQKPSPPQTLTSGPAITVSLTPLPLSLDTATTCVKSPKAGAIVLFAGTTRDSFENKPVSSLSYSAYVPLALDTLLTIARAVHAKHELTAISITHRLGTVPIGEESIIIAVSAPHRQAAWKAGEAALEECKERAEIWKMEQFEDGGVWRANRDGQKGEKLDQPIPKDDVA
ncbi:MAG: Molybdopterin synthase catalytic subunit [Caeruleum heppii]|nr:MAG: Molybdopterin synthase catalytic subunit [Caeruleum heppii]